MRVGRRLRRLAISLAALIVLLGAGLAALLVFLATESGERHAAAWLAGALSEPERRIGIARLQIDWPGSVRLRGVTAADAGGEWLAVDDIDVSWRPLELLRARITVDKLRVETVEWRRLPRSAPGPASGGAEPPSPPAALRIAELSVASLRLGPEVAGAPAVLRIEGALGAETSDEIRTRLRIVRTDGTPAEATLEALLRPRARRLSLKVAAEEPAGGLLPNLIGVPDQPFSLKLAGEGALSRWQGELVARIGAQPFLDLDITIAEAHELGIEVAGRLDLSRHLPQLPSGQLDFEAGIASEDGARWRVERSRWRLPWLEVAVSGAVELAGPPRLALDFSARQTGEMPLPLLPPEARLGTVSAQGRMEGALEAPTVSVDLQAEAADWAPLAARGVSLQARFQPERRLADGLTGMLEVSGTAAALLTAEEVLAPVLDGAASLGLRLRLDGEAARVEVQWLRLALAGATLEGSGEHRLDSETGRFSGAVALPDLSALGASAGVEVAGAAGLDAELRWELADVTLSGSIEGRAEALRFGDARLAALVGSALALAADWQLDSQGALGVTAAALEGGRFRLSGDATLAPGAERLQARLRLAVPELAPLAPIVGLQATGAAEVTARLRGAPAAPAGDFELKVSKATLNGVALGTIAGTAEMVPAQGGLTGRFALSAEPPSGPMQLSANLRRRDGSTSFEALQLSGSGLQATGTLALSDGSPAVNGKLTLEAADLGPWLRLAGLDGAGAAVGDVTLEARDGGQGIALAGTLSRFRLAPGDGPTFAGRRLAVEFAGTWPPAAAPIELRAEGDELRLDEAELKQATLLLSGPPDALRFEAASAGRYKTAFTAAMAGTLMRQGEAVAVALDRLETRIFETSVRLSAPARLRLAADGVGVEAARFAVGEGLIEFDGRVGQQGVDLRLRAERVSLAPLAAVGADIEGRMDLRAELRGDWPTPVGAAELTIAGLRWRGFDDLPPVSGRLDADWQQGEVALQASLENGAGPPLRLVAALPLRVTAAPWAVLMPPRQPVSLEVSWRGDAATVWRLLPYPVHRLGGALAVDLRLSGTVAEPQLNGNLALSQGVYEHLEQGTLLRDLELQLVTDGSGVLRLARLTATDGDGGRLTGEGEIVFRELSRVTYAARARVQNFYLIRRDDLSGRADGTVELSGTLAGGRIEGQLTTRIVEATLIDSLAADVVKLEVVEIGAGRQAKGETEPPGRRLSLALDVQIVIPNRAFLRGRGLESEWAGTVNVGGTTTAPLVTGTLNAVRGRFTILGKTFVLGTSTVEIITADGNTDAVLNISADHNTGDLDVTVSVAGTASQPKFAWNSRPALPRDEIIARLLFGRGTGQLSAFEAVQLASALTELSGRGPTTGSLFDRARRALGVDTLRLSGDATATGGAKLEAGKYLSDNVYVGVQQGAATSSSGARIELQVLPRVSIESEVQATGANIGAKFKWDY